jgi:hypothetical protein
MELLNPLSRSNFPAQTAAFSGTAGSTTGWNTGPEGVMVWSDQPCYVVVGENVTATTSDTPIPAFTPIPFKIQSSVSGVWRVSAIQIASSGTIYCKPLNKQ